MLFTSTRPGLRALAVVPAAALVLVLTGCSAEEEDKKSSGGAESKGAFPISIKNALGTAKITEQPKRVVTLGHGSTETAIALGHTPVGMERYEWGSDKTGYMPWIHEAVTKKGDELPKQFTGGENLDIEAIAELKPDVILAPWSGVTQKQYDVLTDIAPTVAYPGKAWSTNWDQQIEIVSKALGKPEQSKVLVKEIEKTFADAAASRPEYKKHTFSYIYNTGPGTLGVFRTEEQRVAVVSSLGLKADPVADTFKEVEGTDSSLIGLENGNKLAKSDLIFTFYSDEKNRKEIESQKLYKAIPAIEKGAVVAGAENPFVTASSMINPLTVPWSIERYLPLIDKAIEKSGK
ncbi:iron-siderophore ABC transporter substrate-binding protein [Streptomyces sp. NPDC059816]|uniref:iron-siderophore ABC transporter substrate-binding protein n=1 Tax=Streptomyces sp. NPDC059816 TaxID=3346960 RepID=UPI003668AFD5